MRSGHLHPPMLSVPPPDRPILPRLPILDATKQTRSSVQRVVSDTPGRCVMSDQTQQVRRVRAMDLCSSGDAMWYFRALELSLLRHDLSLLPQPIQRPTSSSIQQERIIMTGSPLRIVLSGDLPQIQIPMLQLLQPTNSRCSDHVRVDTMFRHTEKPVIL